MTKKLSVEELHHTELEIMQEFHNFCEKNSLTYYLIGGTLLGAIRHKGFIPWDDDIDVVMPREDYEKFISIFEQNNTNKHLKLATPQLTPNYHVPTIKLFDSRWTMEERNLRRPCPLGPWIDIFPLDNMSDDYEKATKLFWRVAKVRRLNVCRNMKPAHKKLNNLIREPLAFILGFLPRTYLLNKLNKLASCYQSSEFSKYVCVVVLGTYGIKEIMPSQWFANRELHVFEDRKFYIPKGYHNILTNLYGDYMTPPPAHKRKGTHFKD